MYTASSALYLIHLRGFMKGPHHDGKPEVSDVIKKVLEGFTMKKTNERPEAHHLDGVNNGQNREGYLCERSNLWIELVSNPPKGKDGKKVNPKYSVKFGLQESPLGVLARGQHLVSAADFEKTSSGPMALSSHELDPKEPSDR